MWVYQNNEMGNLQTIALLKPFVVKEGITDFAKICIKKPQLALSVPQVHATSLLENRTKVFSEVRALSSLLQHLGFLLIQMYQAKTRSLHLNVSSEIPSTNPGKETTWKVYPALSLLDCSATESDFYCEAVNVCNVFAHFCVPLWICKSEQM